MVHLFVVFQLHLSRVRELDDGADGHFKLPARRVVQPHMISLRQETVYQAVLHDTIVALCYSSSLSVFARAMFKRGAGLAKATAVAFRFLKARTSHFARPTVSSS